MDYENILVEHPAAGVGLVRLNRPRAFNALNGPLMDELMGALEAMDKDDAIRCMVITGSEKVFAAGADISEMAQATPADMIKMAFIARWERLRAIRKPVIAAVSGYALGGGCELAMACDMIVASETAVFGQPEINLGVIPGAGGTQRLARTIGKPLAMEMALNDRRLSAAEAERFGLVNRVVPQGKARQTAEKLALEISSFPQACLNTDRMSAYTQWDLPLKEALRSEFEKGFPMVEGEGRSGAARFAGGAGRGGKFEF